MHSKSSQTYNSMSEIVLVHGTRPELMPLQLKAFLDNLFQFRVCKREPLPDFSEDLKRSNETCSLTWIYICDVPGTDAFRSSVVECKRLVGDYKPAINVSFIYLDLDTQKSILGNISKGVSQKLNIPIERVMSLFCDWKSLKFGGIRGVQNKSIILADFITRGARHSRCVYHKLDDDIFPYVCTFNGGVLEIAHGYDVFGHRLKMVERTEGIVGSPYCIDSPSPLVDLYESIMDFDNLFKEISNLEAGPLLDAPWFDASKKMRTVPAVFSDRSGLMTTALSPIPTSDMNFREALLTLGKLIELLRSGNNRIAHNTLENLGTVFEGRRDSLPGGFVSFFSDLSVKPHVRGANQDLLFSAFEHATGNVVYGDWPVGHIKGKGNRASLFVGVAGRPGGAGLCTNDFMTTNAILTLAISEGMEISKGLESQASILGDMSFIRVENMLDKLTSVEKNLKSIQRSNKNSELAELLAPISSFFNEVSLLAPAIASNYTLDRPTADSLEAAKALYSLWKEDIVIFNALRTVARQA
jgi:hypothetical protein